MERKSNAWKVMAAVISLLLLPCVGYVYSQGAQDKASEQLAMSTNELNESVKVLTGEINTLSTTIAKQDVQINFHEKRLTQLESDVKENSNDLAVLKNNTMVLYGK